ncbi:hypothetical protein N8015_03820 [Planktomarina temperata]|nr:hypothetical protein [Planktomarina temperata]
MDTGLMQPQPNRTTTTSSPLLEQFRAVLSPSGGSPRTIEEKLAALSDTELQSILQTAKFVQMAMQMKLAADDKTMGWPDLVASMYRGMGIDRRSLIAELLEETDPLPFIPEPKAQRSAREMGRDIYERPEFNVAPVSTATADDETASALESVLADTFPEPQRRQADELSFIKRLTQSESSGDSNAEIIIEDGKRYVGALQFGDARLQDYKNATGSSFTQDEFKANSVLQDKVAAWHIADIDKTIDGIGINTDVYDRDGLRAVAHLGGKGGMNKFVRSNGEYNPSDELGTSLQDYYDKFAVQS